MQGRFDITHCYKTTAACGSCAAGQYRIGCGCLYCDNSKTYNQSIYNFDTIGCGNDVFACGTGSCWSCPAGYTCAGGNTKPTRCTRGYYQTATGATTCLLCECPANQHVPTNSILPSTTCEGPTGMDGLCKLCDRCTDETLIKAVADHFQHCMTRDWSYGRLTGKTDQDGPDTCIPCKECAAGTYSTVQTSDKYCLTDQTGKQCQDLYYKIKDVFTRADQGTDTASNIATGPMPFVPGWQRNGGTQHKPGPDNNVRQDLNGHKAILPYYKKCTGLTLPHATFYDADVCLANAGSQQCASQSMLDKMLQSSMWFFDCLPQLLAHCAENHYARMGEWTPVVGLAYVEACVPCPIGSTSVGGRVTQCICNGGFAMALAIREKLPNNMLSFPDIPNLQVQCVHCSTQVYIQNYLGQMQQEAIACPMDGTITRCTKRQYLLYGNCADCANATQIPDPKRKECTICKPGTYTQAYNNEQYFACLDCNPYLGKYQDKEGQNECATKTNQCPTNQMVVPNYDATKNNDCKACQADCADPDAIQIRYANQTGSCDDKGNSYFGCFSLAANLRPYFPSNVRYSYVLSADAGGDLSKAHLKIEECTGKPAYSRWLSYEEAHTTQGGGKQCFFACQYGINTAAAKAYGDKVHAYLQTDRVDLLPFWDSAMRPTSIASTLSTIPYRVNYASLDSTAPTTDWAVHINLNVQTQKCETCNQAFTLNLFLLVADGLFPVDGICRDSAQAKSQATPCDPGFLADSTDSTTECAFLARTGLYHTVENTVNGAIRIPAAYYVMKANVPVCRAESADLVSFQALCNTNCLELRHAQALALWEKQMWGSMWERRMSAIHQYLKGKDYWQSRRGFNPYDNLQSNQCHFTKCAPGTFRYDLSEHNTQESNFYNLNTPLNLSLVYACVPCDREDDHAGTTLCSSVYDSADPRFYNHGNCSSSAVDGRERTAKDVCDPCAQTLGDAVLIQSSDTTEDDGSSMYQAWWTVRQHPAYLGYFVQNSFEKVNCRYKCPAGFRSNDDSVSAYNKQPCVACTSVTTWEPSCRANTSVYFNPTTIARSTSVCGGSMTYIPYKPQCAACSQCTGLLCGEDLTNYYVYLPALEPYASQSKCMAKCDPSKYHTVLTTQLYSDTAFQPRDQIQRCQPCAENANMTCGGTCQAGHYMLDNTSCHTCNTSACPDVSMHREACPGSTLYDAQCLPCSRSWLFNSFVPSTTNGNVPLQLAVDIKNLVNVTTRRWVPSAPGVLIPGTTSCRVACVNNHMWIDTRTAMPPTTTNLTSEWVCIPCHSPYIAQTLLQLAGRPLYSVWNSTNTTVDTVPVLRSGIVFKMAEGACYFCSPGHDTLAYGSDVMCESMPGYSDYAQGTAPGTVVVVTVDNATMQSNETAPAFIMLDGNRRRLLQAPSSASYTLTLIRARTAPILSPQASSFLWCCLTYQNLTEHVKCRQYRRQSMEYKKNLVGTALDYDFCAHSLGATAGRRMLLQAATDVMCYAGNYKPARGATPCFSCPFGASTASHASNSFADCLCLPGFTATRDPVTRLLLRCTACGAGFYRSSLEPDDTRCQACPPHQKTPTTSSGFCYCLAGYYKLSFAANETCIPCEKGSYCDADNTLTSCPLHSTTEGVGASTRGQCKCLAPLYYGDLSHAGSECVYVRPGRNFSSQQCALGWTYEAATDGCVSSCHAGEYAELGPMQSITACVPCPLDTYDPATRDLVYIPLLPRHQQCTPCPPNMHTAGPGTANAAGCACPYEQNGTTCQLCTANYYFASGACRACPPNTFSAVGAVGLLSCMCPRGSRAMKQNDHTLVCEPCPLAYYSNAVGLSCTRCPNGFTTPSVGCTTRLQCVPSS